MYTIKPIERLHKEITLPADKSISHRAVIVAAIAKGVSEICPFLSSDDTEASLACIKKLGVRTTRTSTSLTVKGEGLFFPKSTVTKLDACQSGTTMRVLSGVLCGQRFTSRIDAHESLRRRPMKRIMTPLRMMGANVQGLIKNGEEFPPLVIRPAPQLRAIDYVVPVASAQVKSAIIFASLFARGATKVKEPLVTRDHTERMLSFYGAKIVRKGMAIISAQSSLLAPKEKVFIPSDFSSAAFFIVLGLIAKRSEIVLKNVNVNPTRCYLLEVLMRMGANISIVRKTRYFEPYADIVVKSSTLRAVTVHEKETPLMIDEIPILCVAAAYAAGKTIIEGAGELKVKETDRISSITGNLKKAGVPANARRYSRRGRANWMLEITGVKKFRKAQLRSFADHRTAMSMIVFGLASGMVYGIDDTQCISKSFPDFIETIEGL